MPWTQTIDNVTIDCKSEANDEFSTWDHLPKPLKDKLTESVRTAPKMVEDAMAALNGHKGRQAGYRGSLGRYRKKLLTGGLANDPNVQGDPDYTEVGKGLLKYFNLTSDDDQYWQYIDGIRVTFAIVLRNLQQPYNLILSDMKDRGRVKNKQLRSQQSELREIRKRFGFQTEWDHTSYVPLQHEDIEISTWWVRDAPSAREVARTIVHEASHKWAQTTDVLYKHQSFAGAEPPNDPNRKRNRSERIYGPEYGRQLRIRMPGQPRFFLPMMAFEGKDDPNDPDVLIDTEKWLENADSYAWFARRMYKRRSGTL
jgi:hypothetical protein